MEKMVFIPVLLPKVLGFAFIKLVYKTCLYFLIQLLWPKWISILLTGLVNMSASEARSAPKRHGWLQGLGSCSKETCGAISHSMRNRCWTDPNSVSVNAMDRVFLSPPSSHFEIVTRNVMVLGSDVFGR